MFKIAAAFLCCIIGIFSVTPSCWAADKLRFIVVSSYHREYAWSQETNTGFCRAMRNFDYFDNEDQSRLYTAKDRVETAKVVVQKLWLDAKRNGSEEALANKTAAISKEIQKFKPDIIFLGDDDAAKYIGGQLLNKGTPIVFWGVNNTPIKYGLVESLKNPGHNVTGVYQTGYYAEGLALLKRLAPSVKNFTVLSDDTSAGRSHAKKLRYLAKKGLLPIPLHDVVITNDFENWKTQALQLQSQADAFFIAQFSGLKDNGGKYITPEEVMRWYRKNIIIPEVAVQGQFVKQGLLCCADDSGFNQAYEAVRIAHDLLSNGKKTRDYPPMSPKAGPLMVNPDRLRQLGLTVPSDIAHKVCLSNELTLCPK